MIAYSGVYSDRLHRLLTVISYSGWCWLTLMVCVVHMSRKIFWELCEGTADLIWYRGLKYILTRNDFQLRWPPYHLGIFFCLNLNSINATGSVRLEINS